MIFVRITQDGNCLKKNGKSDSCAIEVGINGEEGIKSIEIIKITIQN